MPTPMMLPTISAIAAVRPNWCGCSPSADLPVVPGTSPEMSTLSVIAHPRPAVVRGRRVLPAPVGGGATYRCRAVRGCRHPSEGETGTQAATWDDSHVPPHSSPGRSPLKQAQFDRSLNGLRAGRHAELLVDRPEMGFHGVARNAEGGCHLQVGAGRQELQDA